MLITSRKSIPHFSYAEFGFNSEGLGCYHQLVSSSGKKGFLK